MNRNPISSSSSEFSQLGSVLWRRSHSWKKAVRIRNWSKLLNTITFHLFTSPHFSLYASFILFTADRMDHIGGIMALGTAVLPIGARKGLLVLEKDYGSLWACSHFHIRPYCPGDDWPGLPWGSRVLWLINSPDICRMECWTAKTEIVHYMRPWLILLGVHLLLLQVSVVR